MWRLRELHRVFSRACRFYTPADKITDVSHYVYPSEINYRSALQKGESGLLHLQPYSWALRACQLKVWT